MKENIINVINKVLEPYNVTAHFANNSNAISVDSYDIDIWIRLLPVENKYKVEISSVEFSPKYRRKGIFTSLFNKLVNCEVVSKVVITSVCTPEMKNWCLKNGLKGDEYENYTL